MTTAIRLLPPADQIDTALYPSSDGEPMGESTAHVKATTDLYVVLQAHFAAAADVFVAANLFLYYEEGKPTARKAPDVMVVKGLDKQDRRSFFTWIEKRIPCTIFEFTSEKTWEEDLIHKKQVYASLGVKEYFLFDPYGEYLPDQLMGYKLKGCEYVQMKLKSGGLTSSELGVRLVADGRYIRLIDSRTREPLLHGYELYQQQQQALERAAAPEAEAARLRALLKNGKKRNGSKA
jgi:Uma2 family endonuclease